MRRRAVHRSGYRIILFIFAVLTLYSAYHWGNRYAEQQLHLQNLSTLKEPRKITPFQLTDQFGSPFSDEGFDKRWNLLLFGYSHSEQATEDLLFLATRVYNRLAAKPDVQRALQVILVTVDPERDTPKVLKPFIGHYSPDFIGLTGPQTELRKLTNQLGVIYKPIPTDGSYRIDHSTSISLINPDGELVGTFRGRVDPTGIATDIIYLAERFDR